MEQLATSFGLKLEAFLAWLANPISQMLLAPLVGVIFIALTPKTKERLIKFWALLFSFISLVSAVLMVTGLPEKLQAKVFEIQSTNLTIEFAPFAQYQAFSPEAALQFANRFKWLSIQLGEFQTFGVEYFVAADGLSLPLLVMSSAIIFLTIIWALNRKERVRDFFALVLFMEVGLLGAFVALDYVLFFLFWEWMLIPMYFLIAGWGKDKEKAGKAAIKFFVYTLFGSVFMLISFITMQTVASGAGIYTFSITDITVFMQQGQGGGMDILPLVRMLMFVGLLLAFAVKAPMFPFHTWLPDAHTEAPTEMSVILAAIMLKTGTYAYLRILYPTFPDVAYAFGPVIAFCGIAAIVYGGAITLVQTDLKRMVAYSSISHMGFIILGISALNGDATVGAIFHMVGHGLVISVLFFMCGVVERRYGTRDLRELSAMLKGAPPYALTLGVAAFAGMGLPGLVGFWGEFLVLKGTFFNNPNWTSVHVGALDGSRYFQILAFVAVIGVLIGAVYMINMLQRVMPGEPAEGQSVWKRFRLTDGIALIPLLIAVVFFGLYPAPIINACIDLANYMWETSLYY